MKWCVVSVLFAACGGGDGANDCRSKSCEAPFSCVNRSTTDLPLYACASDQSAAPTCSGTPSGQLVRFGTSSEGANFDQHWTTQAGGCVTVTYDASVASKSAEITSAVQAIQALGLSLCFTTPTLSTKPMADDGSQRRIHFRTADTDELPPGQLSVTQNFFETATGRLFAAEVVLDPAQLAARTVATFLHHFGIAIGLASSDDVSLKGQSLTYSVVTDSSSDEGLVTAPTAADATALTRLYGTGTYCGD